ncbi:MAG: hypothetical protein WKF73_15505 [Nocardioidaceae bacterium]
MASSSCSTGPTVARGDGIQGQDGEPGCLCGTHLLRRRDRGETVRDALHGCYAGSKEPSSDLLGETLGQ